MTKFLKTISYFLVAICILLALAWSVFSIPASLLALLSGVLFLPQTFKYLKNQKNFSNLTHRWLIIPIAFVFLITGLAVVANSPGQQEVSRKNKEKLALENQQKADEEKRLNEQKKIDDERKEVEDIAKKAEEDTIKAKKDEEAKLKNAQKERANQYMQNISMVIGVNGFWLTNNNEAPFKIQNLSLNYNDSDPSRYFDFVYPQGQSLNSIRKQDVNKGEDSEVFSYTEFVSFPDESTFFVKGLYNVKNVQVQATFIDPQGTYGTNEFTATFYNN